MFKKKPTASEVDGVQYRRAKTWQIICYACNALVGMSVYSLIGMASYSASIGYGITTAAVGIILTCTRILDGITDPLLAFVYDRVNTKFGKLRVLLVAGYLIEAVALYAMFTGFSSKGMGLVAFTLLYVVYVIGYTITNMTAQTIPAIMTNDPRQRPTIGVWTTAFNYLVPMVMSMVLNVVLLPKCGGTYNQAFLTAACNITLIVAAIGTLLVCLGVSAFDKPENFVGTKKAEPLKMADIVEVLKHNKPLQCYIASNASDKLAQQVGSQAIINNPEFADVRSLEGVAPTKKHAVFTIAVPTTAGTAAEVTINYVITDVEKKRKFVCVDTNDIPEIAVVDPDMMSSMPKGLTAATGMDALTHAIEGYITKGHCTISDMFHLEAIKLISENLRGAVQNTPEGREGMALGQYIAGMGFSNVGLGIVHSMAHGLSALYDTPHGVACAIILPTGLEYNKTVAGERYRAVGKAMGVTGIDEMNDVEAADATIAAVKKLSADVGIPADLKGILKEEDVQFLAESAFADACCPGNPRDTSVEEIKELYRSLM